MSGHVQNFVGWPWTLSGPFVSEHEAKSARLRLLILMETGDHRIRFRMSGAVPEALFELGNPSLTFALRAALRQAVARYLPGVMIAPGEDAVIVRQDEDNNWFVDILWVDLDSPAEVVDELSVRVR